MNFNNQHIRNQAKTPTIWQVVCSVLAAMFGVQKSSTHQRDFTHGKVHVFIIVGVIITVLLITTLFFVVKIVLATLVNN